jgi:hypothetical protein
VVARIQKVDIELIREPQCNSVPTQAVVAEAVAKNQGGFAHITIAIVVNDVITEVQVMALPVHC